MKHKHYEMIVAKAANMDLVVIENDQHGKDEWYSIGEGKLPVNERYTYFLCLPQHKDPCLHWLNGGSAQYLSNGMGRWIDFGDSKSWSITHLFMTDECELRIKPKKEKRWIGVNSLLGYATSMVFTSKDECKNYISISYQPESAPKWQCIEIEVEV